MNKNVLRETIIALLLCLAIILLLALALYNYMPSKKEMPTEISYTTPENLTEEIVNEKNSDDEQLLLSYEVDSTDVSRFQNVNSYNPGKSNPFEQYQAGVSGEVQDFTENGTVGQSSGSSANAGNNSSSGGSDSSEGTVQSGGTNEQTPSNTPTTDSSKDNLK